MSSGAGHGHMPHGPMPRVASFQEPVLESGMNRPLTAQRRSSSWQDIAESVSRPFSAAIRKSSIQIASLVMDPAIEQVQNVLGRMGRRTGILREPLLASRGASSHRRRAREDTASSMGTSMDALEERDRSLDRWLRIQVAASFVRDAIHGRNPARRTTRSALRVYRYYHCALGKLLRYAATLAFILTPIYEQPGWCLTSGCDSKDPEVYYFGAPFLPFSVTVSVELAALAVILIDQAARLHFTGLSAFRRDWWSTSRSVVVVLTGLDVVVGTFYEAWDRSWLTRVLRIYVFVSQHHNLRAACVNIFRTVPALTEVLLMLCALILLAAWAAMLLFGHIESAGFRTYSSSLLSMYTLSTVTNFPGVTLGPMRQARQSFLFFVAFLCVGVLVLMNLALAIVYEAYRINLASEVARQLSRQRRALRYAYAHISTPLDSGGGMRPAVLGMLGVPSSLHEAASRSGGGADAAGFGGGSFGGGGGAAGSNGCGGGAGVSRGILRSDSSDSCLGLEAAEASGRSPPPGARLGRSGALNRGIFLRDWCAMLRVLDPKLRRWQAELLFHGCDTTQSGYITEDEFANVLAALQLRFIPVPSGAAAAAARRPLRQLVKSRYFELFFDTLAGVTAVAIAWPARTVAVPVHVALVLLFAIEMLLKLVGLGPVGYFRSRRRRFDGVVALIAIGAITYNLRQIANPESGGEQAVRWTLYLWIFRAMRLLGLSRRSILLGHTLRRLIKPFLTFLGVVFCFLYASAGIGLELFGGRLYVRAECVVGTAYEQATYEPVNFNSMASALVLAFSLLMVNDFPVFMDVTARCTSSWSHIYFVLFHLCNVVIVSNLLTSFILEATLRAWADVDAEGAESGAAGLSPRPAGGAPHSANASLRGTRKTSLAPGRNAEAYAAAAAAAAAAAGGGAYGGQMPAAQGSSGLVLEQRARYVQRMQQRIEEEHVTLEDGRAFTIKRQDSFTGLAAMEEMLLDQTAIMGGGTESRVHTPPASPRREGSFAYDSAPPALSFNRTH